MSETLVHHSSYRAADSRLMIGTNALPAFGRRWRMVGIYSMGVRGRLYLDTWRFFDGHQDCYKLVGFGNDRRLARQEAASILRGCFVRYVGAR